MRQRQSKINVEKLKKPMHARANSPDSAKAVSGYAQKHGFIKVEELVLLAVLVYLILGILVVWSLRYERNLDSAVDFLMSTTASTLVLSKIPT